MIDKAYGKYELICDVCGENQGDMDRFDSFQDAVDFKKLEGWKSQKCGDVWQDICPDCQGELNEN